VDTCSWIIDCGGVGCVGVRGRDWSWEGDLEIFCARRNKQANLI
jgi:hypothetical protein